MEKIVQKSCFYTSLATISSFVNIDRPVTFCSVTKNAIFLYDILLISKFKIIFGKFCPVCPKNLSLLIGGGEKKDC